MCPSFFNVIIQNTQKGKNCLSSVCSIDIFFYINIINFIYFILIIIYATTGILIIIVYMYVYKQLNYINKYNNAVI